jgi:hypothetical protein
LKAFDFESDARVTAALDQLLAALSEITEFDLAEPIVVLARIPEQEGLCMFHAGIDVEMLPILLTKAALTSMNRPPDFSIEQEDE